LGSLVAFAVAEIRLEAQSESLWYEVTPLGIKVTIIEPGWFRTDWAGRSMIESGTRIGARNRGSARS
jgi:short-subunit dehydrogenase